ncbi:MAG TPA: serine/threonine-protein kinase [Gemmatimonadaceae bacterium]|nr:serine/threonine-protein kinase [Gemmatimonadaceae bacterium]
MRTETLQSELQSALGATYTIERELPRGGMSRVFVAVELALRRRVVIKVLDPELAASLSAERFKREITLAARLQHPLIVPLLNAGQAGTSLYYTMPLVDGESLRERINRERPMAFPEIVRILEDVASAIAYAHDEGIVHRDVKPENVMFFHDRAVVLDFGIGKALSAAQRDDGEYKITQAGVSLGTPAYIAPEQAAGDPTLDHRADIYAVGVVAYEMITGHPPFRGRTTKDVMAAHAYQPLEPIATRRRDVPHALAAIVTRCLEKEPARRPPSAHEIVRALAPAPPAGAAPAGGGSALARIPIWVPWVIAALASAAALTLAMMRGGSGGGAP